MTQANVTDDRERFENWCRRTGYRTNKDDWGAYLYSETRGAWDGWKGCSEAKPVGVSPRKITSLPIHHFVIQGRSQKFVSVSDLTAIIGEGD